MRDVVRDTWVLETQGSVVSIKLHGAGWVADNGPDLSQRAYAQTFQKHAAAFKGDKYWDNRSGRYLSAAFGAAELAIIQAESNALALDMLHARGGLRGRITSFSAASRRRLIDKTARLADDVRGVFLTLTYAENMQDHVAAKKHLDLILRYCKRLASDMAFIWRLEYQERGAIHFHLIGLGRSFVPIAPIRAHWWKITGQHARVHVKRIDNKRRALAYVAKYITKVDQADSSTQKSNAAASNAAPALGSDSGAGSSNFIDSAYSEMDAKADIVGAESACSDTPAADADSGKTAGWVGRFWGIVNRKHMPWAERVRIEMHGSVNKLVQFRRYAARYWRSLRSAGRVRGRGVSRTAWRSFKFYSSDAESWLRLWLDLDQEEDCENSKFVRLDVLDGYETFCRVLKTSRLQVSYRSWLDGLVPQARLVEEIKNRVNGV